MTPTRSPQNPRRCVQARWLLSAAMLCGSSLMAQVPAQAPAAASTPAATPAKAPGGPAVAVSLVKAEQRDLPVTLEATGTVTARRTVDLRPQVSAVVRAVSVREGETVRLGQVLFLLDDRSERAQLERAQAQLLKDEAAQAEAERQLRRNQDLLAQGFISQGAIDASRTAVQTQAASVAASKAAVNAAEVTLSMMTIRAPQDGRLGAIAVHPGAYVSPAGAPLVSISQLDPVLVSFAVPQRHLGDVLAALKSRRPVVTVSAADEQPAGPSAEKARATGPVVFVDNTVDTASGTVRVKAELDNRQDRWWPGAYVKVRLSLQTVMGGTVIPLPAIVNSARGRSVFVVDDDGVAQPRPVEVLTSADGLASVKGISPGERVVVEGRQNLRPGTRVQERSPDKGSVKPGKAAG